MNEAGAQKVSITAREKKIITNQKNKTLLSGTASFSKNGTLCVGALVANYFRILFDGTAEEASLRDKNYFLMKAGCLKGTSQVSIEKYDFHCD